ncbi:hypothetical protein [Propionivibrio sp.]|uniref:hypothetical protein n=1 Tax=Propionivibrio sp. TaxID=2212460 RepID=UPI003BF2EE50
MFERSSDNRVQDDRLPRLTGQWIIDEVALILDVAALVHAVSQGEEHRLLAPPARHKLSAVQNVR